MNKRLPILLFYMAVITLWAGCKKEEEEEKKISVVFQVTPFPSNTSSGISPTTTPYLAFSKRIDYDYFDADYGKFYKFVIDSSYITNSQNTLIPHQKKYSTNNDTLKFITNNDFPSDEAYKLNLTYHIEVFNEKTSTYDIYLQKGVQQRFQFESSFSTSDYPYFDPNFVVTVHPSNGLILNYLLIPYFTFNHRIDYLYLSSELNRKYRILIDSAGLYNSNYQSISSQIVYGASKDSLGFALVNLLDASGGYKMKMKYHIEVKDKNSETFKILKKDGVPYYNRVASSFYTSSEPLAIDTSYIEYAYPSPYQYHFLKNETARGVLKLKLKSKSSASGIMSINSTVSIFKVRFSNTSGQSWVSNVTHTPGERKFVFQIPTSELENQKIYKIEYIVVSGGTETVFLSYHFRTSRFNTFAEKFNTINGLWDGQRYDSGIELARFFKMAENFDIAEGRKCNGLVRFEAISNSSKFFNLFDWFYNGVKSSQCILQRQNSDKLIMIPPLNAIILDQTKLSNLLSEQQINSNNATDVDIVENRLSYLLSKYFTSDFYAAKSQLYQATDINSWEQELLQTPFKDLTIDYPNQIKILYVAGDVVTYTNTNWALTYY